jgi:hypothetical protein
MRHRQTDNCDGREDADEKAFILEQPLIRYGFVDVRMCEDGHA